MMEEIKECPYCGSNQVETMETWGKRYVNCNDCNATGPTTTGSKNDAVLLWNAAANALAAKDAEIADKKRIIEDMFVTSVNVQAENRKLATALSVEKRRVEAGNKRQDELEAEIEELRKEIKSWLELSQAQLNEKYLTLDQRDEARTWARRLYAANKELITALAHNASVTSAQWHDYKEIATITRNELQSVRVAETSEIDGS